MWLEYHFKDIMCEVEVEVELTNRTLSRNFAKSITITKLALVKKI